MATDQPPIILAHACLYARSDSFREIEWRLCRLREYCDKRNCAHIGEYFDLAGLSTRFPPGLTALQNEVARARNFGFVITSKAEELSAWPFLQERAIRRFRENGIHVIAVDDAFDTSSPPFEWPDEDEDPSKVKVGATRKRKRKP